MSQSDPTQSNGRCSLCGQEEGHSPRCSVTKFGAPDIRVHDRLREGLAARGILAGRNPDGVDDSVEVALMVIDELRQAFRDYADHLSWRCSHPPRFYFADYKMPADQCPCGLQETGAAVGVDIFDPRKAEV